jgi:hypothetical protein
MLDHEVPAAGESRDQRPGALRPLRGISASGDNPHTILELWFRDWCREIVRLCKVRRCPASLSE